MHFAYFLLIGLLSGKAASLQIPRLLLPRQTDLGNIPADCQPGCQGLIELYNGCRTAAIPDDCFCTSSTLDAMQRCYSCFIIHAKGRDAAAGTTSNVDFMQKLVQEKIDKFIATCMAEGFPVDGRNRATTPATRPTPTVAIQSTDTSSISTVIQTTSTTSTASTSGVTSLTTDTTKLANAVGTLDAPGLGIAVIGMVVGFGLMV